MEAGAKKGKLLMISTDRRIFEMNSAVARRQAEHAREWEEVDIVIFESKKNFKLRGQPKEPFQIAPNCFAYSTRSAFKLKYPFDAQRIGAMIINTRGITEITCQDSSLTAMAGVGLKHRFKLPLEIQIHEDLGSPNYAFSATNRIRLGLAKRYIPQADKIRVVSNRMLDFLKPIYRGPTSVKPIEIDVEWIRRAPITHDLRVKYPQFKKIVLVVSRLEGEKNIELAIKSWPLVIAGLDREKIDSRGDPVPEAVKANSSYSKSFPVGLIVVGEGSRLDKLKSLAAALHVEDSVKFDGWANQAALVSYYKTADLFLCTSLFEGYGMSFVEAGAANLKIVSTDVGIARECGATITDWSVESVAKAIINALI